MLEELNHSGYISVDKTNDVTHSDSDDNVSVINDNDSSIDRVKHYAYEYQNGEIVIHAYDRINEINGYNYIIGHGFDNKTYLIYSQIPFDMSYYSMYPLNHRQKIVFLISGYEMNSKYSEAIFSFEELQYFCSSSSVVKKDDRNVCFSFEPNTIKSFDFYVDPIIGRIIIGIFVALFIAGISIFAIGLLNNIPVGGGSGSGEDSGSGGVSFTSGGRSGGSRGGKAANTNEDSIIRNLNDKYEREYRRITGSSPAMLDWKIIKDGPMLNAVKDLRRKMQEEARKKGVYGKTKYF